jgi:serine/threonine protein kinase/regulation of enolase protein 1 (concanavalin A-like superfamily)
MEGQSAPVNGSGPVEEIPRPKAFPDSDGAGPVGGDPTIDFRRDETGPDPPSLGTPLAALPEYAFLEPPRDGDELGWLAHYRVRRLIGSGGMGLVFLAEDTHLLRPVALKVIRPELAASPEAAARFVREARSAAAIKHDHVVTIYQVGEAQGVAFLAMEYLQGVSLQRWLDRGRTPSIDLILRIGREVASGLFAAHRLGLVHRDIKPANIWLEAPNGRAKILDFGQARAEREDVQITRSGTIMGTPAFMSPEQAEGEPVSSSSDLFSLGCVLYRLCCGQLPFQGKTILSVLNALASHTPIPPLEMRPEIPEGLSSLVMRLLAKSPDARPESAQVVVDALRSVERQLAAQRQAADLAMGTRPPINSGSVEGNSVEALPAVSSAQPRSMDLRRRRPVVFAASGIIAVALGSAVWYGRPAKSRIDARPPSPSESRNVGGSSGPDSIAPTVSPVESAPVGTGAAAIPEKEPSRPVEIGDPAKVGIDAHPVATSTRPPVTADRTSPAPAAPKTPPRVETPTPRTPEEPWGVLVDPDGDCRLSLDEGRLTASIEVPGKPHVLSAELRKLNAPRTLRPVSGDFQVHAHVSGTEQVAGRATTKEYPAYHGAGILLWQDPGNYVRLEIATDIHRGKPRHYANFEYRQGARLVSSNGQSSESGSAYLRLERKGDQITASFGPDGVRWVSFPGLTVTLEPDIEIGLVVINTSTKPLVARFEEYQVITFPKSEGGSDYPRITPPAKPQSKSQAAIEP